MDDKTVKARLDVLVWERVHGTIVGHAQVEENPTEAAFIVLWRNEREYGTHRAVLAKDHPDEHMLVWGHYFKDIVTATRDYSERMGR